MARLASTMTAGEFDAALKQLGISVFMPAKVLCLSLRQASGEALVPPSIAKLIRALIALERVDF